MSRKVIFIILSITLICLLVVSINVFAAENFLEKIKGKGIKADGSPIKVGATACALTGAFDLSLNPYPVWLLEQAGADVSFVNPNGDLHAQMEYFEDFANMGKEIIIVQPVDTFAQADSVTKAQEKGIKVFAQNCPIRDADDNIIVDFYVGSPNIAMAEEAAKFIVEKADGKKVKIVQLMGTMGQQMSYQRDEYFRAYIKDYPNIELVDSKATDWLTEKAYPIMSDMLTVTPDLWGIYTQSDDMIPGILAALEQAGKLYPVGHEKHVVLVSIDGSPLAIEKIKEGVLDVCMEQSSYAMAVLTAKAVLMVTQGLDLPKAPDNYIEIPPVRITAENVDDPSLWGNFGEHHDVLWPRTQEIWESFKWPGDEKLYN